MKNLYTLLGAFTLSLSAFSQSNCFSLGTGIDGAFHATADTSIASQEYNFTTFTIDPGVTVSVTGNVPLEVHCTGAATIHGTLTVAGANGADGVTFSNAGLGGIGVAGGGNGGDGVYSTSVGQIPGIAGTNTGGAMGGINWAGGAGAGFSTVGGTTGMAGMNGGAMYGTANLTVLEGGSGGGGGSGGYNCGSGGGGAGGGAIALYAASMTISATGTISANGGDGGSDGTGNCGGGGAGSGGAIILGAPSINNDGMVIAEGGSGGSSTNVGSPYYGVGGIGADGRIRIDYNTYTGTGLVSPIATNYTVPASQQAFTICASDSVIVGSNSYNTTGIYVDTLQAVSGCDSLVTTDLTVLPVATNTLSFDICVGDSVVVGSSTYTAAGVYYDTLTAMNTCDSIITTTVNLTTIDNTVTFSNPTLNATQGGAQYQWLDCDNGMSAIAGAVSQTYTPSATTGNYAVEITLNGCTDVSTCYLVDFTGIEELTLGSKKIVKVTDLLGRETTFRPNTPLIIIYDDGSIDRIFATEE